jgi:hypothetical protein
MPVHAATFWERSSAMDIVKSDDVEIQSYR